MSRTLKDDNTKGNPLGRANVSKDQQHGTSKPGDQLAAAQSLDAPPQGWTE